MNKKKKIISIILVFVVILLGGASIYVATQLTARKSVAPTAPESKPQAFGLCGDWSCSGTQPSGGSQCVGGTGETVWCCPADQIIDMGVCVNEWAGCPECTVTALATEVACVPDGTVSCDPDCPTACGTAVSTISTCTDSCGTAKTKACAATAACVEPVDGEWSDWTECSATACGTSGTRTRTCNNPAPADGGDECTKTDGTLTTAIARTETATCSAAECGCVPDGTVTCAIDCPTDCGNLASTIVCQNSCGADTPKICAATAACPTGTGIPTGTATPTGTVPPTGTTTPTGTGTLAAATPTILPETGIFDIPGIAAFGGGLFLAVIGILLAL